MLAKYSVNGSQRMLEDVSIRSADFAGEHDEHRKLRPAIRCFVEIVPNDFRQPTRRIQWRTPEVLGQKRANLSAGPCLIN